MTPDQVRRAMLQMYGGEDQEAGMSRAPAVPRSEPGMGRQADDPELTAGATSQRGPFVDQVNDDVGMLIMPDGSVQERPTSQLPPGVREGQYLGGQDDEAFAAEEEARQALRRKLMQLDDGGDFAL